VHRKLSEPWRVYRIGDPDGGYPIYSGTGARLFPGRWNAQGQGMIYTSRHYSTAVLEKLIYTGEMPPNQHYLEIEIPAGVSYEVLTPEVLPDWNSSNSQASRAFGAAWFEQKRSAILIVPSAVAPLERNVLINPDHPDSSRIRPGLETPVYWDERLFKGKTK
jgi:RES domain-containing protein